ncbi:MAG TPA: class I SAM-dependent methyltransferase [Actinomycetota bacterium]|nr:class I SAM-dependent methyltransferase [Actinomycetota bacterium]
MSALFGRAFRRFARLVTDAVVAYPAAWRVLRPLFRRQWDRRASSWELTRQPDTFDPYLAGLDALLEPPKRALDVGTGTGGGALEIAARFPETEVFGVDFSAPMVARAASRVPPNLAGRVSFRQADASSLPFGDAEFDLVAHNNMIPFFDEITRVLRPGGHALFAFSGGAETPIYVRPERLRAELKGRGFSDFAYLTQGRGTVLVARRH